MVEKEVFNMMPLQPWHWRSLPLAYRTGSEIFSRLFLNNQQIATLLESPYPTPSNNYQLARYSICAGAPRILNRKALFWTPAVGEILPFLQQLIQRVKSPLSHPDSAIPFTGGWLGWLGYDLAWEIERLPYFKSDSLPFPVAFWYEPECFAVLDHDEQILWLATTDAGDLDKLEQQLEAENQIFSIHQSSLNSSLYFCTSQADYENAVHKAKKYIHAGDIFQTNLSVRFQADTNSDSWTIYRNLQQINPSPFASYWQTPWGAVISCSPERLVELKGRKAETRPIAGTRKRGINSERDRQLAQELSANIKERAEHIMLVDLERNDLGKVCDWGSVYVDELLTIELYSHVMHLVSNVTGNLRSDITNIDLIRAMFPGGTITGCPKVRCMEIIEELEPVRRNLFYGSCGYLDWRGNMDLNILIRTLLYNSNTVWGQVGAGIVADSDPEKEWYESLQKAQAQIIAINNNQ